MAGFIRTRSRGLAGVTHRAADAGADLPQGFASHRFPTNAGLLRAAASHLAAVLKRDSDVLQIAFAEIAASEGLRPAEPTSRLQAL